MGNPSNTASNKKLIILTTLLILSSITFAAILTTNTIQSSTASAKITNSAGNMALYTDSACTQKITLLDWGTITTGASTNKTIYIKNLCSTSLKLSMTTSNWNPTTANGPLTVTWNRQNTLLRPNQVVSATISIDVAPNTSVNEFTLNLAITGASTK